MFIKPFIYRTIIDPLLSSVRDGVLRSITPGESVIDIACGNGTLALAIAKEAGDVTAIDLDTEMIAYAKTRKNKLNITNITFTAADASNLSAFSDKQFGTAVTTMAVHQFDPEVAQKVLLEMKRVASRIIIADYNIPLPWSVAGRLAYGIEWLAGGDHFRNFSNYRAKGGLRHFTERAGLRVRESVVRGGGVFVVVVAEEK
ncbi:MAG: class I SAM-dependent methyltransferase [Bacteroidia bacterium]|nr:class I SAM-dependent methyltransferase [Bacteroidia bacterium]